MTYYLIFDTEGEFKAYTTDKAIIAQFKKDRTDRKFVIRQMDKSDMSKKVRHDLAGHELINFYGMYITPEEDHIYSDAARAFAHIYDTLESFKHCVPFVKFNDDEIPIIAPFIAAMQMVQDKLEEGFYCEGKEDEYDECLDTKSIVRSILHGFEGMVMSDDILDL